MGLGMIPILPALPIPVKAVCGFEYDPGSWGPLGSCLVVLVLLLVLDLL